MDFTFFISRHGYILQDKFIVSVDRVDYDTITYPMTDSFSRELITQILQMRINKDVLNFVSRYGLLSKTIDNISSWMTLRNQIRFCQIIWNDFYHKEKHSKDWLISDGTIIKIPDKMLSEYGPLLYPSINNDFNYRGYSSDIRCAYVLGILQQCLPFGSTVKGCFIADKQGALSIRLSSTDLQAQLWIAFYNIMVSTIQTKRCEYCRQIYYYPKYSKKRSKYCTVACKQAAYRERKKNGES